MYNVCIKCRALASLFATELSQTTPTFFYHFSNLFLKYLVRFDVSCRFNAIVLDKEC
jgi:hypothetical protein